MSALVLLLMVLGVPAQYSDSIVGRATGYQEDENATIATPAFLMLYLWWDDGGDHLEALELADFNVIVSCNNGGSTDVFHPTESPIPVCPLVAVTLKIEAHSNPGVHLYEGSYTAGAVGSYHVLDLRFNTTELSKGLFTAVRLLFRPYDSATGAGLPIEKFNLTVQFPAQSPRFGASPVYQQSSEIPIAGGYLDTYYGLNVTLRVRDYFGNMLYNQTRRFLVNQSALCVPIEGGSPGDCGPLTTRFETWDVPLSVHSVKFYNQKPDQFARFDLYWNGSGVGEEVYTVNSGLFPSWWNSAYAYRNRIIVNTSTGLNNSFDYNMSFDVTPYVTAGKVQADLRDLRVAYFNGTTMAWTEVNTSYNATTQRLYFKAAAWLAPGSSDRGYFVYYGNPLAVNRPAYLIYRDLVLSEGPVSYLELNELSGTTGADSTGNGHTATIHGTVTPGLEGEVRTGFQFSGIAGSYLDQVAYNLGSVGWTYEVWIKPTALGPNTGIINDRVGCGAANINIFLQSNGFVQTRLTTSTGQVAFLGNTALTLNTWQLLDVTYDGAEIRYYRNGVLDMTPLAKDGTFPVYTQLNSIGVEPCGGAHHTGSMDEIAGYPKALGAQTVLAHYNAGIGQNGTGNATLETGNAFAWFNSPGETVERFLNPGYYSLKVTTDNRTGVQSKASLGVNITEATYVMVSGLNITRFVGDFVTISTNTQILSNQLRPDVVHIGELLPAAPTELTAPPIDEEFVLIHPFAILTGTTSFTGPAAGNATLFGPSFESSSGDGALLATITVTKDTFVFSGSTTAHVWVNYTNGTTAWENASLPPGVTIPGVSGDVYVTSNQSITATRISEFRAIWEFSFRYYPTTKRYEQSLTLNNTMNRTVINPQWYVGFPENRTINTTGAGILDLDNNVWLTTGRHFEVAESGYYLDFDAINASQVRRFFFAFYDLNASQGQSTPVITVNEIVRASWKSSGAYWTGTAVWSNPFTGPYVGELIVKLAFKDAEKAILSSIDIVDETTGRQLDPTEYYTSGNSIHITQSTVGSVPVGASRQYRVYLKLELTPEEQRFSIFQPIVTIGPLAISAFVLMFFAFAGLLSVAWTSKNERRRLIAVTMAVLLGAVMFTLWILRSSSVVV